MERKATVNRKTGETQIECSINLDGNGKAVVDSGIGFFDHMLNLFAVHSGIDLDLKCKGDLYVDGHHTVEDCGIVLGQAIREALSTKAGINRYGTFFIPMDESLALVSLDLGGRYYLVFDAQFSADKTGEMDNQLVEEFFRALASNSAMNLHVKLFYGSNDHHKIEAIFKAFAHAFRLAVSKDGNRDTVLSSKGLL